MGIGSAVAEIESDPASDSQPLSSKGSKEERSRSAAALAALRTDVAIGSVAFFAVAPLVFGIQWLLSQFFKSEHPLLELLKENPAPRFFALSAFSAVLVAPLIEEFVFRVLLQGWIERFCGPARRSPANRVWGMVGSRRRFSGFRPWDRKSSVLVRCRPAEYGSNKARHAELSADCHQLRAVCPDASSARGRPIPLFLFAVVLGYLFATTRRILPCIVTHAPLNAVSLSGLWLAVHFDLQ